MMALLASSQTKCSESSVTSTIISSYLSWPKKFTNKTLRRADSSHLRGKLMTEHTDAKAWRVRTFPPKKPHEHHCVHKARRKGKNVFTRLGEREKDVFSHLGPENTSRRRHASAKRHASAGRTTRDPDRRKREARNLVRSYVTCSSKRQREIEREWDAADRANRMRIRIPSNVKTYDGSGDPEDHLKIFHIVVKVERWAMPTWCHMFNSMLIGFARLWFDELPPESIDSYVELRKAFLANFLQQKKYIKDPVEIHYIKQREGDSTKAFIECFKAKSMHAK
ncbi:reverse transcriptase domain-containing protein [Tanacetum coccineum]